MNTAVNMNNTVNMNGGCSMNQAVNMNGGYGMNNVVYFNGANNMNNVSNQFMGIQVNQELVSYLEQGVKTFRYYEEFCEKYNAAIEEDEEIQRKPKKVVNKWRWITIGTPIFTSMFFTGVSCVLTTAAAIALTQLARVKYKVNDEYKAMLGCKESNAQMTVWKYYKHFRICS